MKVVGWPAAASWVVVKLTLFPAASRRKTPLMLHVPAAESAGTTSVDWWIPSSAVPEIRCWLDMNMDRFWVPLGPLTFI